MAKSKELVIVRTQKRKLHNNKRIITGVGGGGCVRERGGGPTSSRGESTFFGGFECFSE